MLRITSLKNPRIKRVVRLRDRRGRDRERAFLIEGYRELLRAVESGWAIDELYVCEAAFQGSNESALIARIAARGGTVAAVTEPVLRKICYRDRPEGLLGVAPQRDLPLDTLVDLSPVPFMLVAEAIEKPGNLGTMLRSADATGADALVLCDGRTDLFNANTVRASTGTLFSVPVATASSVETGQWLRQAGMQAVAASPHADRLYTEADLTGPVALVVGSEQSGLSEYWMTRADQQVRIPMLGLADSLNAATATALLLYEAVRQRIGAGVAPAPAARPDDGRRESKAGQAPEGGHNGE